jgi:chemotaxis signal transduction protein
MNTETASGQSTAERVLESEDVGPYVVFELAAASGPGGEEARAFALDVARVLQVTEPTRVSSVPLAPSVVRGIINHHGRIITVLDPAPGLGQSPQAELGPQNERMAQVVVLRDGARTTGNVGLLVARIRRIVPAAELRPVDVPAAPCVKKVFQYGKRVMHIVDVQALLAALLHDFDAVSR